jgi:peptidoglycan/LPS O-acetylase OafA/YrhL
MGRLKELDFLRGIAIILVLIRHIPFFTFTQNMGWIGVDLFFVLSGFLVSGLLFKEYLKFGNIRPKLFLIRRGFKIYPIYYIFYVPYLVPIIMKRGWSCLADRGFLSDMTFTQNFINGYGWAYPASWSLAVEEHFYFGLAFFLWLATKYKFIKFHKEDRPKNKILSFPYFILAVLFFCFCLRILGNYYFPSQQVRLFTNTQFRIDSLLAGVLISYFFYFQRNRLERFFYTYKYLLFLVPILGLAWTPFFDPITSVFVKTIGFSLLYISFGIILITFLIAKDIVVVLNKMFSSIVVSAISKVGYCSYSIYVIHLFIIFMGYRLFSVFNIYFNHYLFFIIAFSLSILVGMFMTYKIERYFLSIRDKYFSSRVE